MKKMMRSIQKLLLPLVLCPLSASAAEKTYWPNGAQLVISISMQFESGGQPNDAESPFPALKLDQNEVDLPKESWFRYGYTEGIYRMLDLWDKHKIKVTSHIVGLAAQKNPEVAKAIVSRGHEGASHGMTWSPLKGLSYDQEVRVQKEAADTIKKITGVSPVGFNAFWMRGTSNTLKILQELGFTYHIDDLSQDEPFVTLVNGQRFAVIPYTIRNNDIALIEGKNFSAEQFLSQLKMEFDRLYLEGKSKRRMMSVSLHDRIGGTPAMVDAMDKFITYAKSKKGVVFMRKDEIANIVLSETK